MAEANRHQTNSATVADATTATDADQTLVKEAVTEASGVQFTNHQGRTAALLPTSQNQAQASIAAPLRISTNLTQRELNIADPSPLIQVPGAWPNSASSTRNPSQLGGNDDANVEDTPQATKAGTPSPTTLCEPQRDIPKQSKDSQKTAMKDDVQLGIEGIHRDMGKMVLAGHATGEQVEDLMKSVTEVFDKIGARHGGVMPKSGPNDARKAELEQMILEEAKAREPYWRELEAKGTKAREAKKREAKENFEPLTDGKENQEQSSPSS